MTLFPDDDSLLFPDAMQHVMRIYERDAEGLVGGVCGIEVARPPRTSPGPPRRATPARPRRGCSG